MKNNSSWRTSDATIYYSSSPIKVTGATGIAFIGKAYYPSFGKDDVSLEPSFSYRPQTETHVRCQYCGQWGARKCECNKCGAPIE